MSGFLALLDLAAEGPARGPAPALAARLAGALVGAGRARPRWVQRGPALLAATDGPGARDAAGGAAGAGPFRAAPGVFLVGDVRLDDPEAVAACAGLSRERAARLPHGALVLELYVARGEEALDALTGDFAFALVDLRSRRLLAQRDPFGVRPLYVARPGGAAGLAGRVLVGNVAEALLAHPEVDAAPDEDAVLDFLLVQHRADPRATYLRGLRRVPPAHRLAAHGGGARTRRVWSPPPAPERPLPSHEVVPAFREALERAVARRTPPGRVGVLLSGGLDSTSVAACAAARARAAGAPSPAAASCGYTAPFPNGARDEELSFARLAAGHLGLVWRAFEMDAFLLAPSPPGTRPRPAPGADLFYGGADALGSLAEDTDVVLTGYGGDPLLRTHPSALPALARRDPGAALGQLVAHLRAFGRPPGLGLRAALRRRRTRRELPFTFPDWIEPGLAREGALLERWRAHADAPHDAERVRPEHPGLASMGRAPLWTELFEGFDPAASGVAAEVRHPFFDAELLACVAAIPPLPWCVDKLVLRRAMRGRLPEAVRRRPKTPLAGHPEHAPAPGAVERFRVRLRETPGLDRFLDLARLEAALDSPQPAAALAACLPALALADWLWTRREARATSAERAPRARGETAAQGSPRVPA